MSVFHRAFKWTASLEPRACAPLPHDVRDELASAALPLGLCQPHLDWPVSPLTSATDATPSRGGAVVTNVSHTLARRLYRVTEQKGCEVRLDWHDKLFEPDLPLLPALPEVDELVRCLFWEVTRNQDFEHTAHINLQETSHFRSSEPGLTGPPGRRNSQRFRFNSCSGAWGKREI